MKNVIKFVLILYALEFVLGKGISAPKYLGEKVRKSQRRLDEVKLNLQNKLSWVPTGVKDSLASGLATTVVKTILQPLDTVKTLQQANLKVDPFKAGLLIVRERGIKSLWSGLGIMLVGSVPSSMVYFGTYGSIKRYLSSRMPRIKTLNIMVAAAMGNTMASIVRAPNEVIKQQVQAGIHRTTLSAIISIWSNEGIRGFFAKGRLSSQVARDVPYAVMTLLFYETLQTVAKAYLLKREKAATQISEECGRVDGDLTATLAGGSESADSKSLGFHTRLVDVLCGSLAGGLSSFLTTPLDVVKTRMMTSSRYPSVPAALLAIAVEEGLGGLFSGYSLRLAHKIPANGLFFFCYEGFRDFLGVPRAGRNR